jgi:formylglycine-generating enzyme required for sulfatase activity
VKLIRRKVSEPSRPGLSAKRSLVGRADLLAALVSEAPDLSIQMARILGYEETPTASRVQADSLAALGPPFSVSSEGGVDADVDYQLAGTLFWRLDTLEPSERRSSDEDKEEAPRSPRQSVWRDRPMTLPRFIPLAPPRAVLTNLRKSAATLRSTIDIDVDTVVERVSQGRFLDQIPYRQHRAWGAAVGIVEDRAERLIPYWRDQDALTRSLCAVYAPNGIQIARLWDGESFPVLRWPTAQRGQPFVPLPGALVVVLGDLGCLTQHGESLRHWWRHWGLQLRNQGNPPVAVVPAKASDIPEDLARIWTVVHWEWQAAAPATGNTQTTNDVVQRLLTLLAPAVRIEPGLLRAVRHLLPEGRLDPGLEALVWQNPAIASRHSEAASWDAELRRAYRAQFAQQPIAWQRVVLRHIRTWRAALHEAVWFEEIGTLQQQVPEEFRKDREDAVAFLDQFAEIVSSQEGPGGSAGKAWAARVTERYSGGDNEERQVSRAMHRLYDWVRPHEAATSAPDWFDPALVPSPARQSLRQLALWQAADQLIVRTVNAPLPAETAAVVQEFPLGVVQTVNGQLKIVPDDRDTERTSFWRNGQPPPWAQNWGWDQYGAWVTVRINQVEQRLRWISSGRFVMGSLENEEGRFDDEGPQHEVRLTKGFWLFDAPCTQGLWQAVIGRNPSLFKGKEEHPVEQVSWEDCQEFIVKLNALLPGLELRLPTEAEWEYVCRAGTATARYDDNLGAIAWYSENSDGATHPVKQKQPNAWGVYDMLGNVDEWCHDGQRTYSRVRQIDPLGPTTAGADRVFRGGYWGGFAQLVRAAYRDWLHPGLRDVSLGFRCASSSKSQPVEKRPTWSVAQRQAEPARPATRRPSALLLDLHQQSSFTVALPEEGSFSVRTDRDHVRFIREAKPLWATEIGRDKYGLWAAFEIDGVRQCLRWIPPGRFWMGSGEEDPEAVDREKPRHEVQITHGFWVFDAPCTQGLWQAVMGNNPSFFKGKGKKEHPVEQVSWKDCQQFIAKVNAQMPELSLALPTEAEWEYACRAGTTTARYAEDLDAIAWYGENSRETHPVKQKQPNAWGMYDMLGNVDEWCHDGRRNYTVETVADPLGPITPVAGRVIRGGYWIDGAQFVRAACRFWDPPGLRDGDLGFRCASSSLASRVTSAPSGEGQRAGERQGGARADRRKTPKRGARTK